MGAARPSRVTRRDDSVLAGSRRRANIRAMSRLARRSPLLIALFLALALWGPGCLDDGGASAADDAADALGADLGDAPLADTSPARDSALPDTGTTADTGTTGVDAATDTASTADTDATTPLSCAGRCDEYDVARACQCNPSCGFYGNCCADWADLCDPSSAPGDVLVAAGSECASDADWHTVTRVSDGDTVVLDDGDAVRFLVMNTPELSSDDCYAYLAKDYARLAVTTSGGRVCLVADPTSGDRDLYDRLLRYVYVSDPAAGPRPVNLNLRLVRLGYARVYYPYAFGRLYEQQAKAMQAMAQAESRGGWGACGW